MIQYFPKTRPGHGRNTHPKRKQTTCQAVSCALNNAKLKGETHADAVSNLLDWSEDVKYTGPAHGYGRKREARKNEGPHVFGVKHKCEDACSLYQTHSNCFEGAPLRASITDRMIDHVNQLPKEVLVGQNKTRFLAYAGVEKLWKGRA